MNNEEDDKQQLDLRAELARIDRDRAETQKLSQEARKLDSERRHFDRQSWQPMAISVLALIASIIALVLRR